MSKTVLVKIGGNNAGKSCHLPDPENEGQPKCGQSTYDNGTPYVEKDRDVVPTMDLCEKCNGTAKEADKTGPQLCDQIKGAWDNEA